MTAQTVLESANAEPQIVIDTTPLSDFLEEETHWERAAKTRMGRYLTQVETDFITGCVELTDNNLILDVGAEAGRFSMWATKKNVHCVSLDIDSHGLRRLKSKNKDADVILADARYIPLKDKILDIVLMVEVADYIPELDTTIADCQRTLKDKGSIILTFGNKLSLKARIRKLQGKSYLHSYFKTMKILARSGTILSAKGFNWLPFGRTSDSSLIPLLAKVEQLIGLRKFHFGSPWVIVHMQCPNNGREKIWTL